MNPFKEKKEVRRGACSLHSSVTHSFLAAFVALILTGCLGVGNTGGDGSSDGDSGPTAQITITPVRTRPNDTGLTSAGVAINPGDTIMWDMYGETSAPESNILDLTLENTGETVITMSAAPTAIIEDSDGDDESGFFTIPVPPTSPLDPGQTTPLEIRYLGSSPRNYKIRLRIRIDGEDDNYTFMITGFANY